MRVLVSHFLFVVAYLGGREDAPWAGGPPLLRPRQSRGSGRSWSKSRRPRAHGGQPAGSGRGLRLVRQPRRDRRALLTTTCSRSRSPPSCFWSPQSEAAYWARRRRRKRARDESIHVPAANETLWLRATRLVVGSDRVLRRKAGCMMAGQCRLVPDRRRAHVRNRGAGRHAPSEPVIVLLSLEIMLNAANLTLIAFARQRGDLDGQIFALCGDGGSLRPSRIGLGLIVAMARRRLVRDVDQASSVRG